MTKTLRVLFVGLALVSAAAPAFARGEGGGGGNGGGGGDPGPSAAWDPTIAGVQIPPGSTVPPRQVREPEVRVSEDICGYNRGQRVCRPR